MLLVNGTDLSGNPIFMSVFDDIVTRSHPLCYANIMHTQVDSRDVDGVDGVDASTYSEHRWLYAIVEFHHFW